MYAVMFESRGDAQALEKLLALHKIRFVRIDNVDSDVLQHAQRGIAALMDALMDAHDPVRRLTKELERAQRAFKQNPTPALGSSIKRIAASLRYHTRTSKTAGATPCP